MTSAIELREVGLRFSDVGFSLKNITLSIETGRLTFITGRSGSGKSTILNILGLLQRPDSGQYELLGQITNEMTLSKLCQLRAAHIGFIFQSFHLQLHRSVLDNVQLGAIYSGMDRRIRFNRAHDLLERFSLTNRAEAKPATLSGGERQRVAIARALMASPDILLCDEPTGNLDVDNGCAVMETLRAEADRGAAVVVVTHDQSYLEMGDTIFHIRDGQLADA